MSADSNNANAPSTLAGLADVSRWLSPRRKRFWAAGLVLVYTLAGFFAVPALIAHLLIGAARDDMGRDATVGKVRFNPYVLDLEVNNFALKDPDGTRLVGFDQFYANLQLSSLFRRAWTFREVRLDGLSLLFERFAPADSRLTRLLAEMEARGEPREQAPPDSPGLPRLLIHDLSINEGMIYFSDDVPVDPVDLALGPLTASIQELNTLPDRSGRQAVRLLLPEGAVARWQGSIELGPLRSEGTFALENSHLGNVVAYLKAVLPLEDLRAVLSMHTDYRISELADGSLDIELEGLGADLTDVDATGLSPSTEFIAFPALELAGGRLRYPENELTFATVRWSEPHLEVWLDEEGRVNLLDLFPQTPENDEPSAPGADGSAAWHLGVDEFVITGGGVGYTDRSIDPQAAVATKDIELAIRDISTDAHAEFPVSLSANLSAGGSLGFEGAVSVLPEVTVKGVAKATGVPLALGQPYAQQRFDILIGGGLLDTTVELMLHPGETLSAAGTLSIADLSVQDTLANQPLVGWERLAVDRFEADAGGGRVNLGLLEFEKPFGRLVINEDLTTNLTGLTATGETASAPAQAGAEEGATPVAVLVGGITVRDGSMDFSDRSLPLPFATHIHKLGGTVSTIDTQSAEPASIALEGQVDDYGLARIQGEMNVLDPIEVTDVTMEFRNLRMSSLSPYTIQFAGRRIDEGKLDLDLHYGIADGQLDGRNDIVMTDLLLGDAHDSPGAENLPLDLAVALLKDANGVIGIELPVKGDVNDPEFDIGGVIWQAVAGLVTKIVAAPFRLLGSLIGIESEDLGRFQFLAGRADLTPPELEKIAELQQALQQRPELAIEIGGTFDPGIDVPALRYINLRKEVIARLGDEAAEAGKEMQMLDERIRTALETIFAERFPDTPLDTLKAAHTVAPADDPEGEPTLDELAYAGDLRDRLLAAETVEPADLKKLAAARAEAIQAAFLGGGEFDAGRIQVTAPGEVKSEDGEWVVVELGVVAE